MEEKIIEFLSKIEQLKSTLRHNWTKAGRQESSAEHSWRIAIFFVLVHDLFGTDVDVYKTLKMVLIHDIPEVTHGDIPGFVKDLDGDAHKAHKDREAKEAKIIFSKLPKPLNKEFSDLFEEFEEGQTKEAKLAKALDRIESQLQHLESGPKYWSEEEKGNHMLHYPDEALKNLNNPNLNKIWELIYEELKKLQ